MAKDKYDLAIEALNERREELVREIEALDQSIASFKRKHGANDRPIVESTKRIEDDYDPKAKLAAKFAYFLKKEQRFLHFREVAEMIAHKEGLREDPATISSKLSSATQSSKKSGSIVKYQEGNQNRNSFWGIPSWLDENGKIKPGREFNPDYLSRGSSSMDSNELFDFK